MSDRPLLLQKLFLQGQISFSFLETKKEIGNCKISFLAEPWSDLKADKLVIFWKKLNQSRTSWIFTQHFLANLDVKQNRYGAVCCNICVFIEKIKYRAYSRYHHSLGDSTWQIYDACESTTIKEKCHLFGGHVYVPIGRCKFFCLIWPRPKPRPSLS